IYDGSEIVRYPQAKEDTTFTVPDSVNKIGGYAFAGVVYLEEVTIGDSVEEIGSNAFAHAYEGRSNLNTITIGKNVKKIGACAFHYSRTLTNIVFEDTTTWYATEVHRDWTGGSRINVSDSGANVTYFVEEDAMCWYKVAQ
ncbi:MAG: leucine-rich repeat domain-containing protein, partial [Clostridia bacterium]|nr:leucine-rich repeat domain-containing protein [Clostridia bacterium]